MLDWMLFFRIMYFMSAAGVLIVRRDCMVLRVGRSGANVEREGVPRVSHFTEGERLHVCGPIAFCGRRR